MRRRPVAWFFVIALAVEVVVIAVLLFSGAIEVLGAAQKAAGLEGRTDFVSAARLVLAEPQSLPGVVLSILQPLSPDIAAFAVATVAFGAFGIGRLVRGYRFWGGEIGRRRGLRIWGLMALVFVGMSLATAALNAFFMPDGTWEWSPGILSLGFPVALFASIFLDIGGVTEETGWRGFALPLLQARMAPLAATLVVGLLWGVWHFPARPDILLGDYGLAGGAALLAILVARFVILSVVMTYFYNTVGGSTLIAIAMHGLHNDSVGLMGRITGDGLAPYVVSELTLLAPIVVVACVVLAVSRGRLGLTESARWGAPKESRETPGR